MLYESGMCMETTLNQLIQGKLRKVKFDKLTFQEKLRGNMRSLAIESDSDLAILKIKNIACIK